MFQKLKRIDSVLWFESVLASCLVSLVGGVIGVILSSLLNLTEVDSFFVFGLVFFLVTEVFLIWYMLSLMDGADMAHRHFLLENPTLAEFKIRFPDLYSELYEQNPEALGTYCRRCSGEMRIQLTPKFEEYDPNTGELVKHKLKVFCSNDRHTHYVTVYQQKKKKRIQGEDLLVVEDDGTDTRLPHKLESIG